MVGVFADQHMREQAGARAAALDGAGRQRRLDKALAAGAGQPEADDPVHDEAARHILELLGHVLADPAQLAAAVSAGVRGGADLHHHARDVVRDRTALRLALLLDIGEAQPRRHRRRGDLARFQRQLQLLGRLGGGTEAMRPMPGQLVAQLLDQDRLRLHLGQKPRRKGAQLLGVFRHGSDLIEHDRVYLTGFPMGILSER